MYYFQCTKNNPEIIKMVNSVSECINAFEDGEKELSFQKSSTFYELFLNYIKIDEFNITNELIARQNLKDHLENIPEIKNLRNFDNDFNEIWTNVARYKLKNKHILPDFAYEHNVRFLFYFITILGYVNTKEENYINYKIKSFTELTKRLDSTEYYFNRKDKNNYSGRKKAYFDNAYRAEYYSHFNKEWNTRDCYTPIILFRMAIEQFGKYLCEKYSVFEIKNKVVQNNIPKMGRACFLRLLDEGKISPFLYNEVVCVLQRGNLNTHQATSSYIYELVHSRELIEYCFNKF